MTPLCYDLTSKNGKIGMMFETSKEMIARLQLERAEALKRELPREDASTSEGVKALLAINGGGIVSMLGFMQALINKNGSLASFKFYGCTAMLFFGIGVVLAALVPALRVLDVNNTLVAKNKHYRWEYALYIMWALSVLCFIVAITFVGVGVQNAVN
jgi:hypothetical protein